MRHPLKTGGGHVAAAEQAAAQWQAALALKGPSTVITAPGQPVLHYAGGGVGLATGGSGDVLAGIAAALLARGTPPYEATAWAVWVHGEAGRLAAERHGKVGFLARELLPLVPALICADPAAGPHLLP